MKMLANNRVRHFLPASLAPFESLIEPLVQNGALQAFAVPAAVWEDENSYHIEMDVPGVGRDGIDLTYEKGTLRISAERPLPEERTGAVDERRYGKVTRTVSLPESIDVESIQAELNAGVLRVTVAKTPEAQPKRIEIK